MNTSRYTTVFFLLTISYATTIAQEHEADAEEKDYRNSLSISIAHAHISQGIQDGDRKWIAEPSIMIDYNYKITERWSLGLHSDLIMQTFKVERRLDDSIIERSFPFCAVGIVGYKPVEYLTILIGGGAELEEEENFGVFRIGLESGIEISERWEMPISLTYDAKIDGYDTWSLGIGIARLF